MIVACLNGVQSFPGLTNDQEWMSAVVERRLRAWGNDVPAWTMHYGKGGPSPLPEVAILRHLLAAQYTRQSLLCVGYSYGGHDIVRNVLHPLLKDGRRPGDWKWIGCITVDADWIKLAFWRPRALLLPVGVDHAHGLRQLVEWPGRAVLVNPGGRVENQVVTGVTHSTIPHSDAVRVALDEAISLAIKKETA
jgi:hypothetical protein